MEKTSAVTGVHEFLEDLEEQETGVREIEAKVSGETILLRIQCQQRKGVLTKLLSEVENLHLSIFTLYVSLFATSHLVITIFAKMEEEFCSEVEDVEERVGLAVRGDVVEEEKA